MKKTIKLSQWAKNNNYSYRGAFGAYQRGKIPGATKLPSGSIVVEIEDVVKSKVEHTIVYARVSPTESRTNLDLQAERVSQFCNAKGWIVKNVIKDYSSGLKENRVGLNSILRDRIATRIVVEHKDRLTRFGFNYIQTLYPECEIVVMNEESNPTEELLSDLIFIISSSCADLFGKQNSKQLIDIITKALKTKFSEQKENK